MGRTVGTSVARTAAECRSGDELSGSGLVFRAVGVMSFFSRPWGGRLARPWLILRLYVVTGDELSESGKTFRALACIHFFHRSCMSTF